MVEMLNKLEFMLMGLRQMNLNAVCAWFTNLKREDIIKAIEESPKFKLEGNIVSLKSETELYEEELQKDILKDLMGDMGDEEEDDEFSDYDDDDLEIVEELGETPKVLEDKKLDEDLVLANNDEDNSSDEEVTEDSDDLDEDSIVDSLWVEAKEPANIPEVKSEEDGEENNSEPIQEDQQEIVEKETVPEEVIETSSDENAPVESKEYFEYYYNKDSNDEEKVENKETGKVEGKMVDNNVVEKVVEKVVEVKDTSKINGSDVSYEELIRIIEEYNENIEDKINYATEHSFEVKVKAIRSFYENKYNVRIKENNILDTNACIFALIHKKKGMEVAYLVVCEVLTDEILNYMLDNYDEEVVYFCPVDGTETDFEVGLNEFYLKDTQVIFDKFLEHYVVVEECDLKVKKLQVIVGNK